MSIKNWAPATINKQSFPRAYPSTETQVSPKAQLTQPPRARGASSSFHHMWHGNSSLPGSFLKKRKCARSSPVSSWFSNRAITEKLRKLSVSVLLLQSPSFCMCTFAFFLSKESPQLYKLWTIPSPARPSKLGSALQPKRNDTKS